MIEEKPTAEKPTTETVKPDVQWLAWLISAVFNDIHNSSVGQILTLIDTLGFENLKSKSIKDLIKKFISSSLKEGGRKLDESLRSIDGIEFPKGITQDPPFPIEYYRTKVPEQPELD